MKKCIFFDADGTILDIQKGIPSDVKPTIQSLTAQGHLTFLCTGRSRAFIPQAIEELGFSGMITNLGAYMEYNGKCIFNRQLSAKDGKYAVEVLRKNGFIPVLEGSDYMYYDLDEYTKEVDWFADIITQELGNKLLPIKGNENNLHYSKISAKKTPNSSLEKVLIELNHLFDYICHEGDFVGKTIEFVTKGCSKGLAIAVICAVLGIDKKDTVAFGDSNNDLSMFEVVNTKIAMGNASQELMNAADYVTNTLENGGISQAVHYIEKYWKYE